MSDTNSATDKSSHMLFLGQQCHSPQCYLVDFLPFKCDHCHHSYCAEHYKPEAHVCENFDPSKHDRVAPTCPLCDTPVAIPPNENPNIRMERHIEKECTVATGRKAKINSTPVCSKPRCGKKLLAPIKCPNCNQQFCATHRYPSSHVCNNESLHGTTSTSSTTMQAFNKAKSTISSSLSSSVSTTASNLNKTVKKAVSSPPTADTQSKTNIGSSFKADRYASSPSSLVDIRTPTSSLSSSSPPLVATDIPAPASPPSPHCKPLDSLFKTSWAPPSIFGTA
ncbi:hypothetical protein Clacol_010010 [Clathrus columnatus]|uniref:AN1-type domain-containing protein n=1 Tax=Clathrus columnatus TaxID=1419009 RepID=A0AAV5APQ2_9AGAM|nr:hypothetical protein Clacol_010010 [Clathrus columnatus]